MKTYEINTFNSKTNTPAVVTVKAKSFRGAIKALDRSIFITYESVYCVDDDEVSFKDWH